MHTPPPPPARDPGATVSLPTRIVTLVAVVLPLLGVIAAIWSIWAEQFGWLYVTLLGVMYVVTGLGISVGYHRLFTHRSFETPRWLMCLWGVLGSMAVEGGVLRWAAVHRKHHQHSDDHDDPHSPNTRGNGFVGVLRGLWHSHMGWMFDRDACDMQRYVPDLYKDRAIRWVSTMFPLWVLLGMLIPAALGGLVTLTWTGALLGLLWGGLMRIFLVHHVTWSINSVCHLWGTRAFKTRDQSRNNAVFGVLGLGEGWHNNHHAFPTSARHGLRWWEFDASYLVIRLMALCGLARRIRVPSRERMTAQRMG